VTPTDSYLMRGHPVKEARMGLKNRKCLSWVVVLAFCATAGSGQSATHPADKTWRESHPDIDWGMSLSGFRALTKAKVTFSVVPMEARALDYLLMGFHEVDKDDSARLPEFSAQTAPDDQTTYVFYGGQFCLAAEPIVFNDLQDVKKILKTQYPLLKSDVHGTREDFSDSFGKIRSFLHCDAYAESPSTVVCLVRVTGYYEDELYYDKGYSLYTLTTGELKAAYLVHLSRKFWEDETAYRDWLANRKNPSGAPMDWLARLKCAVEN